MCLLKTRREMYDIRRTQLQRKVHVQLNWINGHSVMLMLKNGASNAPINWDGQVTWVDGTAPTLDNSDWNVIEFWKANNTIYGVMIGKVA